MKVIHRTDLNIEDIRTNDYWNRFRIFSILDRENFNSKLDVNALVEHCLTHRDTTLSLCKQFYSNKEERKVSLDWYDLKSRTYVIDNLPIFTYLKLANIFLNSSMKLRDWKYIDRQRTYFVRIPKQVATNIDIRKEYESIQLKSISNYRKALSSKNVNSKKYSHLLLPLGIQNRAAISLDINENINLINTLLCSDMVVENQLGDMFEMVIKSDINISPDCSRRTVVKEILEYLSELVSKEQKFENEGMSKFRFKYVNDIVEQVISNFELLINPLGSKYELEFDYNDQVYLGNLMSKADLGLISKSKGSVLSGYLSLAHILELLSFDSQIFIPFLSDFVDIDKELNRPNRKSFLLPKELDGSPDIKKEFIKNLTEIYSEIKEWRKNSKEYMSDEMSKEFTRYLLPVCHMTKFNLYLDVNDIFALRNRDFEYRDEWMKLFYQKDPLFKKS
ncbi:MAG: Thymidylate synthase complementing protein [candidate division WS6 bacterium 34_10]|uniref:Thymidylate synthase complementing protein n=1 Tax=candidate division WS6 bacterium 34_10 TaxID=1641389 RepID=A0A101HI76_9BACT|nr:MAG: Thymidylate synthase complementing protein [candidate division WS6 bacterium 34_10]